MRMIDIIEKKKHGKKLTREEISFFVKGYTDGSIPDYQASAFAMAVWFNKMDKEETAILTDEMAKSGDMLDLSSLVDTVDKHSSGGIGDKTTLIVGPIAAAAGCTVAKMSGRGLGFTGGTIDKLESIPGFSCSMSPEDFMTQSKNIGIVVAGQTGNMAPCDKKLYALRDVTNTVDCLPLIASSIMSKKLAAGAKNIVLDVKCGSGAFMQNKNDALDLAKAMVDIGKANGRNTMAFITDMSTPLGYAVGNTLEVVEAIKVLKGEYVKGLSELCHNISAGMISISKSISFEEAEIISDEMIKSGKAFDKFKEMVIAQGGDVSYIDNISKIDKDVYKLEIKSEKSGYISKIDGQDIGNVSVILGAGREVKEADIDIYAGVMLGVKVGDKVDVGDIVLTLYSSDKSKLDKAKDLATKSFEISEQKQEIINIILDRVV